MACSQPFSIDKIRKNHPQRYINTWQNYVPCGWCLNCRKDKQNELLHRCEYEYIDKKCGAFVTFTFDDAHMLKYMHYDSIDKQLTASLSKVETKKFLDRLNKIVHSQQNSLLCNHNYKYLVVGEYGEHGDNPSLVGRPHLHCLFFGLDFAYCEKLFAQAWKNQGEIFIGNIGDGAIGYVLKYLDKQLHGEQNRIKYENHNRTSPFQNHSLGLGSKLYDSQFDYIKNHHNNYRWHGKDLPVPTYYKNKLYKLAESPLLKHSRDLKKQIKDYKIEFNKKPISLYDLKQWSHDKSLIRQRNLAIKMRQNGSPVFENPSMYEAVGSNRLNILPSDVVTYIKNYKTHKIYRKRGNSFQDTCKFFDKICHSI